jgi:hypothetical protein
MLVWLPLIISALGLLIAAIGFIASRPTRKLDEAQLERLKSAAKAEMLTEAERLDEKRRREDDARAERQRKELNALSRRSNELFGQWQDAVRDLDELWAFVEDEVLPWQRRAFKELRELGSEITAPPQLARRHHAHD